MLPGSFTPSLTVSWSQLLTSNSGMPCVFLALLFPPSLRHFLISRCSAVQHIPPSLHSSSRAISIQLYDFPLLEAITLLLPSTNSVATSLVTGKWFLVGGPCWSHSSLAQSISGTACGCCSHTSAPSVITVSHHCQPSLPPRPTQSSTSCISLFSHCAS